MWATITINKSLINTGAGAVSRGSGGASLVQEFFTTYLCKRNLKNKSIAIVTLSDPL